MTFPHPEPIPRDVTVVVTSIPPRWESGLAQRALASVVGQEEPPVDLIVQVDYEGVRPAEMRNRALAKVTTTWVAWLDDDDELYPEHLRVLLDHADATSADLVYPWFDVIGGNGDPLGWEGKPFDRERLLTVCNYIPVTHLVKADCAKAVGGFPACGSEEWPHEECEDWGYLQRLARAGYAFSHLNRRTWAWHHHGLNTSGKAWK